MKDKSYYARLYGVSEKDIVPEFLPILSALEQNSKANKELLDSLKSTNTELSEKIKGSIKTNNYHDLTPFTALMLRWGWGLWVTFILTVLVFCYPIISTNLREFDKLTKVVKYDFEKKQYFISSDDYKFDKEKKGITFKVDEK